jgi:hypothetical protein
VREIKFRAVMPDRNATIVFALADLIDNKFSNRELLWPWLAAGNEPDRFTGLLDKNGKEIYEGDICRFIIGTQKITSACLVKIIWLRSAWGFEHLFPELCHPDDRKPKAFYVDPFEGDDWDTKGYFTVISNIHENPELLETKP